jgi:hypothetical protein
VSSVSQGCPSWAIQAGSSVLGSNGCAKRSATLKKNLNFRFRRGLCGRTQVIDEMTSITVLEQISL